MTSRRTLLTRLRHWLFPRRPRPDPSLFQRCMGFHLEVFESRGAVSYFEREENR